MIVLHDFFRSSASYRVRIALNLKGLAYERRPVNFRLNEQTSESFLKINSQGLVPALEIDGRILTQSLAIIDYLDATRDGPRLIPVDPAERAGVLSLALAIACDIHPLNNLRVLEHLKHHHGSGEEQIHDWYTHWINSGLGALERHVSAHATLTQSPGLFEICLVPQLYNARRYHIDLNAFPALLRIDEAARALPAFAEAAPENFAPQS